MSRQQLERHQVWIYVLAILAGLVLGRQAPGVSGVFEAVLWPVLGCLLYTTFTQVPLTGLPAAFRDRRFMGASLGGNFIIVPLVVWGLLFLLPDDPVIRLGVALVLLVPCTDWYITFTYLAGGDTARAIAATPVNLLLQIILLPVYLWLLMGNAFLALLDIGRIASVFVALILLPLLASWLTERWAERTPGGVDLVARIGWFPVPLLGLVVFLIAASQVQAVMGALPVLGQVLGVFLAFLVLAALIGVALGRLMSLPVAQCRALIFSLGTRNSFVVLPLALAMAPQWQTATVVIVFQALVELFGMVVYLWIVPKVLAPLPAAPSA
ncbi:MAG: bile acid:sodium symporter [Rhodobacteraceae bacterium CG17_big_fil_post_rev_8_21_14_2_50_63_15]|nr:arsenic resistance protein [Roseovarius sp.]PIV79074.1 MAG: bile acid:sodium symporter [Rhodobacteraceae bacterium CG17_big_fil_post_rev_8_21_14_2_50_63_15]